MSKADNFLPSIKADEIFKRTRGRVAKIESAKGGKGRARPWQAARTLTAREKAVGIAYGKKETVVKFDKASQGIKTAEHMHAAADYIARHGKKDLEDENGNILDLDAAFDKVEQWRASQNVPFATVNKKRPADARRCILSCPPGTDPQKLHAAARQLAQEIFKDQGFEYVMAIHYRDSEHPKEPLHPHVHFLIKAVNKDGKRLNLRKVDLRYIRERFAVIAKEYGIDLNATSRAVRGQTLKAKTQARVHQEQRRQSQAQKWAIHRKKQQYKQQEELHPYEQQRRNELAEALKSGHDIADHPVLKKAKQTRSQVLQNVKAYIDELANTGDAQDQVLADKLKARYEHLGKAESAQQIKLRIAKRKAAEKLAAKAQEQQMDSGKEVKRKQTQAQKWAINRKKQQRSQDIEH